MTQTPRGVSARAFIRALQEDGFAEIRVRGSHHIYRHPDGRRIVVAYHALNDTFALGTLKGMIVDIGWNEQDLYRLNLLKQ
jgi:predicted RNA binding protein YcfA (HicA-like mRNA interferase family)